jgi:hypothetical protein
MASYKIITLVDITRSNAHRSDVSSLKLGQQANFNSLVQAIGLRSNIDWRWDPKKYTGALPNDIAGKATHWIWEFETERDYVFQQDDDPVGLLVNDLYGVPVVIDLENSADITPAAFQTKGNNINTWIYIIS